MKKDWLSDGEQNLMLRLLQLDVQRFGQLDVDRVDFEEVVLSEGSAVSIWILKLNPSPPMKMSQRPWSLILGKPCFLLT